MTEIDFTFVGYVFIAALFGSVIGGLITIKFNEYLNNNNTIHHSTNSLSVTNHHQQRQHMQQQSVHPTQSLSVLPSIQSTNIIEATEPFKSIKHYRLERVVYECGRYNEKVFVGINKLTRHKVEITIFQKKKLQSFGVTEHVQSIIDILLSLNHPNVEKLVECITTKSKIYLVKEYMANGELFDYIVSNGRLVESEARKFFQQIIFGVEYCHYKGIFHRDLRPENILLDDYKNICIKEFSLAKKTKNNALLTTSCGSTNYAAPEVISGRRYIGNLSDIWSCGCILYALLCGTLPFDDDNIPNLFRKIKNATFTIPKTINPNAAELIRGMLTVDPMKRMTINDIKQHCWFKINLSQYLKSDGYIYMDGDECIIADKDGIEFIDKSMKTKIYLPKGIKCLIHKMLDPMFGVE